VPTPPKPEWAEREQLIRRRPPSPRGSPLASRRRIPIATLPILKHAPTRFGAGHTAGTGRTWTASGFRSRRKSWRVATKPVGDQGRSASADPRPGSGTHICRGTSFWRGCATMLCRSVMASNRGLTSHIYPSHVMQSASGNERHVEC
jgi:hypothetical protein